MNRKGITWFILICFHYLFKELKYKIKPKFKLKIKIILALYKAAFPSISFVKVTDDADHSFWIIY
jgi:hypothetical protein